MLLLLLACAGSPDPSDTGDSGAPIDTPRGDCDPVDDAHCLLPFPSSFYLEEDASTGTGYRVALGPTSLPADQFGTQMRPDGWNRADGFPILGPIYALLAGAELDGVVGFEDLGAYAAPDAKVVLVDADTGERVPIYVEREAFPADPARAALVIHPAWPLRYATRYVVGIRGLTDAAGAAVAPPAPFAALRDGAASDDPDVERQRERFDAVVFPTLEATGLARGELQLAWDFVTESTETTLAPLQKVRDEALAALGDGGPAYTLTDVQDGDCSAGGSLGRRLTGLFTAPLYLESDAPGSFLARGDDGLPVQNGTTEVPFTVIVPCSVLAEGQPARLVQFGHGLFGSHTDVAGGTWVDMADEGRWVLFATSWRGMSADDVDAVTLMMATDPSDLWMIGDGLVQGQLEGMLALRMMMTSIRSAPELMVGETSLLDPDRVAYFGVSLGSVLGGAQVAASPVHDRAVMQISGMPFGALLTRSASFTAFLGLLGAKFDDPVDVSVIVPLAQMVWDPVEAGGWANHLVDGAAVGGRDGRRFLFQVGIGDDTVTSLGGHVYARSVGAGLVPPAAREVWGLDALPDAMSGSGLTEWDYGYRENPEPAPAGLGDNDPHYHVFGEPSAQAQIVEFLNTGALVGPCEGVCDPG